MARIDIKQSNYYKSSRLERKLIQIELPGNQSVRMIVSCWADGTSKIEMEHAPSVELEIRKK